MAEGDWIAQGPDTPAPTGAAAPVDPWTPVGPDTSSTPALVRAHQDPNAHPIDNTRGLMTRTKQLLFGHEPQSSQDPDQHYQTGVLSSLGQSIGADADKFLAPGPDVSTLATAYPHLLGAQVSKIKAGYQETTGAAQVQSAEQTMAALNVLPQVAARSMGSGSSGIPDVPTMAKDPAVRKTAIKLGIDPTVFAGQWAQYAGMTPEEQASAMADAKETLEKGQANRTGGTTARATAWAEERAWQPTDLMHGKLDPWSLKGIAFNTALAIPELGMVAGATLAGTAVGSPGLGVAAGGATAVALFAPAQRAEAKDKIDDQVSALLERADAVDAAAPIGEKRGLNPQSEALRQSAADLAASSDKIANTAGVLYAVADAAGAVPVSAVLSKSPLGKVMLDRMVGAAASKTVGGRIGGAMVANGAGGILQASIQKAVDAGIVHENTSLSDALKDIAYTGVVAATTAGFIKAGEERLAAPANARAQAKTDADELHARYTSAGENLSAGAKPAPGEEYPGYKFNEGTRRYESTDVSTSDQRGTRRLAGPSGPAAAAPSADQGPAAGPAAGAPNARATYQAKTEALNEAASRAEKRSDVSLQPEEEGWSVHVKGEPIVHFDTAAVAREAMAAARKLVGTKPAKPVETPTQPKAEEVSTPGKNPVITGEKPKPTTLQDITTTGESPTQETVPETVRAGAPTEGPRQDMTLSPEQRAAERERVANQRDADEGTLKPFVPEIIPKRAAEHEGEAARRDSETDLPEAGVTAAAQGGDLAPNGKPRIKERTSWHGLPIGIENPTGSFRSFKLPDGTPAKRKMKVPYGEFTRTDGADGDGVDVFMAGKGDKAHVIDQLDPTGKTFDEHKVILGAKDAADAKQTYLDHYQKGWKGFGGITELDPNQLKRWLKEGNLKEPIDPESVPRAKVVRGAGPDPRHDSLLGFLARHPRGLDSEEAARQGIDPADMALSAAHVGIRRAFRKGGLSFDHAAEALHEAGYPVANKQGHYDPNVLLDKIDDELRGTKVLSSRNQAQVGEIGRDWSHPLSDEDLAKLTDADAHSRLEKLRAEQERLEREIERAGLNEEGDLESSRSDLDAIPFMRKGGKPPGVQQDLFGANNNVKNEIKRLEAELDKRRSSGQESVETGRPDDLFSQARKQTDLTDQPTREPAQVSKSGALEDAGAKIGGARKDRWAERGMRLSDLSEMTETEAAGLVTKKAVWNPQWGKLIEAGMPKDVAAISKVLMDQLGAKPRNNTPQGRRDYVQAMGMVRAFIEKTKSVADMQDLEGVILRELGVPTGYAIASTPEQMRARDIFWSIQKGRRSTLRVAHSDLRKVRAMIEAGWPEKAAPAAPVDDGKPKEDKAGPKRPHLDRIERIGPPVRKGEGPTAGRGMSPLEVRAQVDKILKGFSVKPNVVVAKNLAELQANPKFSFDLAGYEDGDVTAFLHPPTETIHLVADQFSTPGAVATTMAHEYITHFGLRAAFGDARNAQYQAILDGVREAMPAAFRQRGEAEYPGTFNPLNASHRNRAAEEVLAYYGQQYSAGQSIPARAKRWLTKLLAMLRDLWRSAWGLPKKFDELFVKRTLADLESYLRRSQGRAGSETEPGGKSRTGEPAFAGRQDTFFSGLAKAVDAAKRDKGTGAEWEATLRNMPGVKAEELQWTGLKDWLEGRGRVAKAEVAEFVHAHTVRVGEVEHGGTPQAALNDDQLDQLNERMAASGYGDLENEQLNVLMAGGPDTEHMLEELYRMGINVQDMVTKEPPYEAVFQELRDMGYQVHEDDVTGQPYLMTVDEHGIASEAHDGDIPPVALDLLDKLRKGPLSPPKYPQWATPGGKNYRELLMTLAESKTDAAATERARVSAAARLKAETDSRFYERAFMDFLPAHDQVLRANASHWLADAATPRGNVIRDEAITKLHAAVDRMSPALRSDARHAMQQSIVANRVLYAATQDDANAQGLAKNGGNYRSQHWDEKNVLAHIRFDDRTGPNGERVLHLHEIQSDWHQAGRKGGYVDPTRLPAGTVTVGELSNATEGARHAISANDDLGFDSTAQAMNAILSHEDWESRWGDMPSADVATLVTYRRVRLLADAQATNPHGWAAAEGNSGVVPDAPFKTTWPELAMKRMLRYAAERGYDALSWDTGSTNAERYNMQQVADKIHVTAIGNDSYNLVARKGSTTVAEHNDLSEKKLADLIGKDMAQKAVSRRDEGTITFKGDDLKVGGAGMRGFYDDILPKAVNKLVKKWGSSVEPGTVAGTQMGKHYVGPVHTLGELKEFERENLHDRSVTGDEKQELRDVINAMEQGRTFSQAVNEAASEPLMGRLGGKLHGEMEAIPAHTVQITPAMRDSVMAGQPMFLKRRKGSAGAEAPTPKKGAYAMARRAVAAIPNNEFTLSLRRIADPAGVSEASKATAIVTREALGELAQNSEEALKNLERFSKVFDTLSIPDRYEFIDAMEGGKPTRPDLQPAADAIRKLLDGWRENIRGLGVGALDNFIENYFPHIWQRDDKAKKIFGQIFGRRPLKGPASFLKERTIPTTREGLDAGLVPISSNPLVLAFAKLREMMRFYTGVKLMQRFKDEGLAKFLPASKLRPDDWAEINDAVGRVRQWSEAEQGFIERGKYIMPTDAARVINNHLSASALRNFLPAQIFRVMSNAVNALQLGFSAFHLGFTTLDAIISKNALSIERLAHGEPLKAAQALLEGILGGPVWNIRRGSQLLKAYSNLGGATPQMRRIVEGLMAAGGRIKMDNYFQAAQGLSPFKGVGFATLASDIKAALTKPRGEVDSITKVLTSFPQQYAQRLWRDLQEVWRLEPLKIAPIMSALEIAGRMTRASTSIIMEHIVPLQKLGVFSDLAADHIRRNPLEDPVVFADAMQKIWNSVDNRLGEMVYDNVFWNRTFKDVNHMMVRAVGWNLGTIRELGGAPIDVIKLLDYMARGAPAELNAPPLSRTSQARLDYEAQKSKLHRIAEKVGHKIPYALALIATTMILGAALTYLFTGKGPEEIKDYFFPWTGRKTKYGTKERISMPSYTKDLYEYATQPMTTIINKANPIFGIAHSIYANEDFFGNAVRNPDHSWERQTWDSILYGARQVQPFSLQGTKQFVGAGEMDTRGKVLSTMPYVGFGPAPARVTSPEQMERYQLRETEKSYIRGLNRRLKVAIQKGDEQEAASLRDEIRESKVHEKGTEHDIRQDKVKAKEAADKISSLIEGKGREDAAAALRGAGMPAFAELWRSLPEHPKPRVAASLEDFA